MDARTCTLYLSTSLSIYDNAFLLGTELLHLDVLISAIEPRTLFDVVLGWGGRANVCPQEDTEESGPDGHFQRFLDDHFPEERRKERHGPLDTGRVAIG